MYSCIHAVFVFHRSFYTSTGIPGPISIVSVTGSWKVVIVCVCRHTCFVQEFQILDSREELILRLRGALTDLEVWCLLSTYESCFLSTEISSVLLPSVLWHCWLGDRKSIRPVKNWVMTWWCGYVSRARCKWFAYGPANATDTTSSCASDWFNLSDVGLPRLSWKTGPLNACLSTKISLHVLRGFFR